MTMILDLLRACPVCGHSLGLTDWLCTDCYIKLIQKISLKSRMIRANILHYYLIDWDDDIFMNKVVYSIKGGRPLSAFQFLVNFFPIPKNPQSIIYPSKGRLDHASVLAHFLGEKWQQEAIGLLKTSKGKQSLLNKGLRKNTTFQKITNNKHIVFFVDDIVTTGSTVLGAYNAISCPNEMIVWSLFYRKKKSQFF